MTTARGGYFDYVVVLSREAFDEIEFDAACTGDHRGAAQQMTRLADTGIQTTAMPRSEAYVRAGEQWLLADDPEAAVNGFRRALDDGGPASVDPRIPLARALFLLGRTGEAAELIRRLAQEPPRDPRACDLLAELLVERSDLPGALAWATAGVQLCLGQAPGPVAAALANGPGNSRAGNGTPGAGPSVTAPAAGPGAGVSITSVPSELRDRAELRLLLSLRFRVRNDLGLTEDDYDRLLDQLPPGFAEPGSAGDAG